MKHKLWALTVLIVVTALAVDLVPVKAVPPDGRALVRVEGQGSTDLADVEAAGVPVYARLRGSGGAYLLAGATSPDIAALRARGLDVTLLDADLEGASYYLVYPMPGRPRPEWSAYGCLLFDDGVQVLLRISPAEAERLARAGARLRAITLDPKPLRPLVVAATMPTVLTPDPLIHEMIDQVDSTTVFSYTGDLSGMWPVQIGGSPYALETRHTGLATPIQKATQYVGEHLAALGLDVEYQDWDWPAGGYSSRNVIGELTGESHPEDIYILCAHLDDMPSGDVAPGADDNASGSTAVLVAADILSRYRWGCTLRFALWTGEEQGLFGSDAYAQRAYAAGEQIAGVLNLDMIAWNSLGSAPGIDLHADSSLPATLDLANLFAGVVDAYDLALIPEIVPNGSGASDHASFWDYGYTAVLGIEDFGDFNPYYHRVTDTRSNLDQGYFTEFVKASVGSLVHMSDCLIRFYYLPLVRRDTAGVSTR